MAHDLRFDPFDTDFRANALERYMQFQTESPVHKNADDSWLLTKYDDVRAVLTEHEKYERPTDQSVNRKPEGPFRDWAQHNIVSMNPPEHTRFRASLARAFSNRSIRMLEPKIELLVKSLLDELHGKDEIEFIEDFAFLLPVIVICELIGVPPKDRNFIKANTSAMLAGLEVMADAKTMSAAAEATTSLHAYLADIAKEHEVNPKGDIFSLQIGFEKDDKMSRDEVIYNIITLLIAGHETTTYMLGNGLVALIRNPDQLADLRQNLDMVENAVEETLRYGPSLHFVVRRNVTDVVLGGKSIPAGSRLFASLAAANRDPEIFDNADTFDIRRENASKHLSFAAGRHLCAGHLLARLEGQMAFRGLLSAFHRMELTNEPVLNDGMMFRGFEKIQVRFG